MGHFIGYREPIANGGGARNGYFSPKAKQSWEVGDVVSVGFVKGLEVIRKERGIYLLWQSASNRFYTFQPHGGIVRHRDLEEALECL